MNYDEAMNYIEQANARGIMPGLTRVLALLDELGHPEQKCNVIHVAGTNGKGSVCTYIAEILRTAGYRVGRYVSPTLYDYRERIQIDGEWITKDALAKYMSCVKEADERMQAKKHMEGASAFELETALAFLYFVDEQCDFIVLETGMGGREDATNVVPHPVMSVITPISMDHMHFLGDTIEAIASEKGGIIKPTRPVVIGSDDERVRDVLIDICKKQGASYRFMDKERLNIKKASLLAGQNFDYRSFKRLKTMMLGSYQPSNAAIAIEVAMVLQSLNRADFIKQLAYLPSQCLDELAIIRGIRNAWWPGRFEVVQVRPLIIVDGAHNPDGAMALKTSIQQYIHNTEIIFVMGVFADKNYNKMLEIVSDLSDTLIAFKPDQPRGLAADKLQEAASHYFAHTSAEKTQEAAIKHALSLAKNDKAIICFGSLSTIASLMNIIGG